MEKQRRSVLIAAKPGPLRDGIRALLTTIPQVETVRQVNNLASAHRVVLEHHPDLVLLDASLSGEDVSAMVRTIRPEGNSCCCLVLVDSAQQRQEAESAGADVVLPKGFPASELLEIMEWLLSKGPEESSHEFAVEKEGH